MIYLSEAVDDLCGELALHDDSLLKTSHNLLSWIEELSLEGRPVIHGRLTERVNDESCELGKRRTMTA
jgi:hypothetical protein